MKSYLDLVPISAKEHRKQNRMSIFCIALAVLLVTVIFGMADMFIRSQILKSERDYGAWHITIRNISDEQAAEVATRSDVGFVSSYGILNYRGDDGYTLGGKNVMIIGCDESLITEMQIDALAGGVFPSAANEALVTVNAAERMGVNIGDVISVFSPDGSEFQLVISGFLNNTAMVMSEDAYAVCLNTAGYRDYYPDPSGDQPSDYNSVFYVQFSNTGNVQKSVAGIKQDLGLNAEQISENAQLLALLGQGSSSLAVQIYGVAAILFVLVLLAGIMMIASSLNSNVANRTQFFGMIRCIGATKRQVIKLVRLEALNWCIQAIPLGVVIGIVIIWGLSLLLRVLSPEYFGEMPALAISWPSILAGTVLGLVTVFLASGAPAKRASKASPVEAVSGNASNLQSANKAANTRLFKVDIALGVQHAIESRKNYILMSGSFALSIILFLSFSVTIAFMNHALNSLEPWTPDLSVSSQSTKELIPASLIDTIRTNPTVKRAYGRMAAEDLTATIDGNTVNVNLISYEDNQFLWAEDYIVSGSVDSVKNQSGTGMVVYNPQEPLSLGQKVELAHDGQLVTLEISGVLYDSPFHTNDNSLIIIVSEATLREYTGVVKYSVVDIQLARNVSDADVNSIRAYVGDKYTFADRRLSNESVQGSYYSFSIFIYGFLALIALVTIFNIVNSIALSVSSRTKQYGVLRAIGLSKKQLTRMITSEAAAYAFTGAVIGTIIGVYMNYLLFSKLVSFNWGDEWSFPIHELTVILAVIVLSVLLAIRNPVQQIKRTSIVDVINAQ